MIDINAVMEKLETLENTIKELKAEIKKETKPFRLAFVNFFAGSKSYAYTADDTIAEGDVVMVPTASRGNIPGVVVYTENYAEDELPFRDTKTVIGKLQDVMDSCNVDAADLVRMTAELAPAIAAKEESKSRLLAFLERRSRALAGNDADGEPDELIPDGDCADTVVNDGLMENEELEGDDCCPADGNTVAQPF